MSRYLRLKIEGGAFFFTLALAGRGSGDATKLSGRLANERVGTALRAFAHPTLASAKVLMGRRFAPISGSLHHSIRLSTQPRICIAKECAKAQPHLADGIYLANVRWRIIQKAGELCAIEIKEAVVAVFDDYFRNGDVSGTS